METNIFERGTREDVRFNSPTVAIRGVRTPTGELTVQDAWSLDVRVLNQIAITLNDELESSGSRKTFLKSEVTSKNKTLQLKFDIIKHIIDTKQAEAEIKVNKAALIAEIEQFEQLKKERDAEKLKSAPDEEINSKLAQLKAQLNEVQN